MTQKFLCSKKALLLHGDCIHRLKRLPDETIQCCVTSPPYFGLRDYGVKGQIGLEESPEKYIQKLVETFREVRRVLKKDGTLWLNLGDSYGGSGMGLSYAGFTRGKKSCDSRPLDMRPAIAHVRGKMNKQLLGIPWRAAFALQTDGWCLRQDIIWHKPSCMPESVRDRCTKSHEYIFLLTKSPMYYFDHAAIREPAKYDGRKDTIFKRSVKYKIGRMPRSQIQTIHSGPHERWPHRLTDGTPMRSKRSVWTISNGGFKGKHYAAYPPNLIKPCILAGARADDIVLDPFAGSGTTGQVALSLKRRAVLIELNPDYLPLIQERCAFGHQQSIAKETQMNTH